MESKNNLVIYYKHNDLSCITSFLNLLLTTCQWNERERYCKENIGAYFPNTKEVLKIISNDENIWGVLKIVDEKKYLLAKLKYGI